MRTKQAESSERIRHVPCGFCATLGRERLGKDEIAVDNVGEAESCRGPKGKTQIDIAQIPTDGRANDEAESECCADQAERLGALVGGSHIGDVGESGRNIRSADTGNEPADEEPAE